MLDITQVDHIGIRIKDQKRSILFYELLGFVFTGDAGFDDGHPIIMKHPSGVVINLLGPSSIADDKNILMDVETKYTGITHVALRVTSRVNTEAFLKENNIEITGRFEFNNMKACFVRDPDRNVIEFDEVAGDPSLCLNIRDHSDCSAYDKHR